MSQGAWKIRLCSGGRRQKQTIADRAIECLFITLGKDPIAYLIRDSIHISKACASQSEVAGNYATHKGIICLCGKPASEHDGKNGAPWPDGIPRTDVGIASACVRAMLGANSPMIGPLEENIRFSAACFSSDQNAMNKYAGRLDISCGCCKPFADHFAK